MKTIFAFVFLAMTSFAFAQESASSGQLTFLILPQPSPTAANIAPVIQVNGLNLKVSFNSDPAAKQLIARLFATTNAYSLHSQNAQFRRFAVKVTGMCFDATKIQKDAFGFPTSSGQIACVEGSEILLQSLEAINLSEVQDNGVNDSARSDIKDISPATPSLERPAAAAQL